MTDTKWIAVADAATEEEAAVIAGFLKSRGISALVDSKRFHQEPVNFGELSPVEVKVPAEQEAEAMAILTSQAAAVETDETDENESEDE